MVYFFACWCAEVLEKQLSLSEVCWKSGVPIEGEQIAFLKRSLPGFPGGTLKNFG
jgi:hypothetical protein